MIDIVKVTSGSSPEVANFVDALYARAITAGTHKAPSIAVTEAAKVIENTQWDMNIALVNELALIFQKLGIDIQHALEAAGTKWTFCRSAPGWSAATVLAWIPITSPTRPGDRPSPGDDPLRPGHQRFHGPAGVRHRHQAHDPQPHPGGGRALTDDRPDLQGKLPKHSQHPGGGWEYVHVAINDCSRIAYNEIQDLETADATVGHLLATVCAITDRSASRSGVC
jgi:hypothetical protein